MAITADKKKVIASCVLRLVRKNSGTLHILSSSVKALFSGNFSKRLVSDVFDFDPASDLPVEDLVAESLLNGLEQEDIEEVFRRYAGRKGLKF
jgi:hypothetical protein